MVNRGEGTGVVVSERGGVERASGERRQEGESPGGLFSKTRRCCCDRSLGTKRRVERQLPNLHPSGDSVHLNPCVLPLGMARSFYDGSSHSVFQDSEIITRIPGHEDTGTCTELQTLTAVRAHRHAHVHTDTPLPRVTGMGWSEAGWQRRNHRT